MEVFAFEGNLPTEKIISWGAAALRHDGAVWNPALRRKCSEEDAKKLIEDGHLTALPASIQIDERYVKKHLVVAVVRLNAQHAGFLLGDTGRMGGLLANKRTHGFQVYVFADIRAFDHYAENAIDEILHRILFSQRDEPDIQSALMDVGMTLQSGHPFLLATWVHLSDHDELVKDLALANLRDKASEDKFNQALEAYSFLDRDYEIIYEGGVSEGGGMDLDVAANTFKNLNYIHVQIEPSLERHFPFLQSAFAPPRFQEMKAASAHLKFSAGPKSRPLGERLARVLELRAIQGALEGKISDKIRETQKFDQAVRRVVSPSPDTEVTHRPIDLLTPVPVEARAPETLRQLRSPPLVVIGFQEDVKDKAHRIGVRLGPTTHIWVSATDNGEGEQPEGLEFLHKENDFLFRPAIFSIERRLEGRRRELFCLLKMKFLDTGQNAVITAFPSTVVDGAYISGIEIRVKRVQADVLSVGRDGKVHGLSGKSLGMASGWIRAFAKCCFAYEVEALNNKDAKWIRPARDRRVSSLARVIVALQRLGGNAPVAEVVGTINSLFGEDVRTNNTRREVLHHPEFLEFVGENQKSMKLTETGRDYFKVYVKAGGHTGRN